MKTCIELLDLAFPVKVEQAGIDRFTVTYGKQSKSGLNYSQAAHEFGCCVFHALACDSKLDNRKRRDATEHYRIEVQP